MCRATLYRDIYVASPITSAILAEMSPIIFPEYKITNVERDGFWLLTEDGEYFVPYDRYHAFRTATIEQIFNFEHQFDNFHWPDLDVDIELDALKHPENYPLIFRD